MSNEKDIESCCEHYEQMHELNIQKVRAKNLWHLTHRITRKILSHTVCIVLNKKLGHSPIQFENLILS